MLNPLFIDLYSIPGMTETKLKYLLHHFSTPERIFEASTEELLSVPVIDNDFALRIKNYQRSAKTKAKIKLAEELRVETVSYKDKDYPVNLVSLPHTPPVLFLRGKIEEPDKRALAIVGTRRASNYGRMTAEKFANELAAQGFTIISGLARGVDTYAHTAALKIGRTIAVLGCGIDICYPSFNKKLYEEIASKGAVVSEFPLGTPPWAYNFPKRNRIISGLALGVLAVEASEHSGVMNTVRWALEQGRAVFAVPGEIDKETSKGTNRLIKDGATPVTSIQDILEPLGIALEKIEKKAIPVNTEETKILEVLSSEPVHIDLLAEKTGMLIPQLLTELLDLEIKGLVTQLPGKVFVKNF